MGELGAREAGIGPAILPNLGRRFALVYAALAAALFSVYAFPFELFGARHDYLSGYLEAYARLAGAALRLVESGVVVTGNRIDGRYSLQIVRNCDAIEVNILFVSAVLAFPAAWSRRLLAAFGGLGVLVLANVARICTLYFVGVDWPDWFAVAHDEILPLALIGLTSLTFLGCARTVLCPAGGPLDRTSGTPPCLDRS